MKKIALIFFAFVLCVQAYAQQIDKKKALNIYKYEKYERMKRTGAGLTIVGAIAFGSGLIIALNSFVETTSTSGGPTQTTTHGNPELGAGLFLLGCGGLGAGIPLWTIGSKKEKYYKKQIDQGVSLGINPQLHAITLAYKF